MARYQLTVTVTRTMSEAAEITCEIARLGLRGDGVTPDGAVVPACMEACATGAITFGDINDPKSRVAQLKRHPRNYEVLRDINTKPRTSYLARVRNPNPALEKAGA